MYKTVLSTLVLATVLAAVGCSGAEPTNSNANSGKTANSNGTAPVAVNIDPANMPPGLSASPIQQPANMPGVNSNTAQPKGGTPTPGIPSPAEMKKPFKPGATPTPGIPSPEEIRKMLGKPSANANAPGSPMKNDVPMMKSNKPTAGKPKP